jgi:hypothetical protein
MQLSRALTFLFGCILLRIIIAYLAYLAGKNTNKLYLSLMGVVAIFIALGFLIIYFNGSETADKQLEIWDDDKVMWWNQLRLIHGALYLFFFVSAAIYQSPQSYLFLVVDVSLGLLFWILHHSLQINF